MKDWERFTDEELVLKGQLGDHEAMDEIINRYKNVVRKTANKYFLAGADSDDLVQEGMIGLYQAYRDYTPEKKASFKTFANICIAGQMKKAVEAAGRNKHMPLNKYVSFFAESDEGENVDKQWESSGSDDPAELYIDKENVQGLLERIRQILSPLEWEVFIRYIDGASCAQIGEKLQKNEKAIGNARDRIRNKIMKEIS